MAFGATSAIFNSWLYDITYPTTSFVGKLNSATYKAALFGNTGTPDNTAVSASCAYNAGQWLSTSEVTDATNWVAGGRTIGTNTSPPASYVAQNYVMWSAPSTAGGGNVTLANVYGDLCYDSNLTVPVAKQAICYHSYGGSPQGVTAGTFTIIWNASGLARWTHTPA